MVKGKWAMEGRAFGVCANIFIGKLTIQESLEKEKGKAIGYAETMKLVLWIMMVCIAFIQNKFY